MHHFTFWTLIISRINRAWLYKCVKYSDWQPNVILAQSIRHQTSKPVMVSVMASTLTAGNFIFCSDFLKPLDVNSGLKCKCDLIMKNSNAATQWIFLIRGSRFSQNSQNCQYWHQRLCYMKTKITSNKMLSREYWTWNLSFLDLIYTELLGYVLPYLGDL